MTNEQYIEQLHPSIQRKARDFITGAIDHGFNLRITSGYRSIADQNTLYAQGRTTPGKVVTNAKGGESFHNFGLAFDVFDTNKGYNLDWNALASVAANYELEHGDRGYVDLPHFQFRGGLSLSQVQAGQRPIVDSSTSPANNGDMDRTECIKLIYRSTQGREPSTEELNFALGLTDDQLVALRFGDDVIGGYWKTSTGTTCPQSEKDFWVNAINVDRDIEFLQTQWYGDHVSKPLADIQGQLNIASARAITAEAKIAQLEASPTVVIKTPTQVKKTSLWTEIKGIFGLK